MRLPLALLLVSVAGPAFAATHQYGDLAMSPDGRTLAMIETTEANGAAVTLRDARDGHIIRTIDPCEACRSSDPLFGPAGTVPFLMRDCYVPRLETEQGHNANHVATINGIPATPPSPPHGTRTT